MPRVLVSGLSAFVIFVVLMGATPPAASAADYIPGIDVSHWQGQINWPAVRADGVRFAFIKATESTTFSDPRYATNVAGAEAAGVLAGAYHFAQPAGGVAGAEAQADHFVDTANLRGRHLLPVLDLEVDNGLGPRALRRWVKAWLARVEYRLGVKAIIYTSPSFWRDRMGDSTWFAANGHRLWIAHWEVEQPRVPAADWGGRGWSVWQHSSKGTVSGITGASDRDWFFGASLAPLRIRNNR